MLRIYSTVIEVLRMLRPVIAEIERHDRDLARQLRRASASVARASRASRPRIAPALTLPRAASSRTS
jgi:hypothetical protein